MSRVRAGQRRKDLLICVPSKLFLTLNLRVNEVWHRYLYISKQETPHSVILVMAVAESAPILIQKKKKIKRTFCISLLLDLGVFGCFFFEKSQFCPVTGAGSFHAPFS